MTYRKVRRTSGPRTREADEFRVRFGNGFQPDSTSIRLMEQCVCLGDVSTDILDSPKSSLYNARRSIALDIPRGRRPGSSVGRARD
jgi:hypothetical protein